MKLALAQMKMDSDMKSNYNKSMQLIREASKQGAEFICFPEIQLTPFFPQYEKLEASVYSVTLESPYVKEMCALCRELNIYASPNFYIEANGNFYDMSLQIDNYGEIIGKQKMVYIAMCNRVATEDKMTFSGESIVTDYNGDTVALAGASEELLIAEVDLLAASKARRERPYIDLRRKNLYE